MAQTGMLQLTLETNLNTPTQSIKTTAARTVRTER